MKTTSCSDKKMPAELISVLEKNYAKYWWQDSDDYREAMKNPFKNLIFTLLSQNTSSENTRRAYAGLKSGFDITPESLVNAGEKEISRAIKPGGLHRTKARRIKEISSYVLQKFDGDLSWVFDMPKKEARAEITKIPGIGDKTADTRAERGFRHRHAYGKDSKAHRACGRESRLRRDTEKTRGIHTVGGNTEG